MNKSCMLIYRESNHQLEFTSCTSIFNMLSLPEYQKLKDSCHNKTLELVFRIGAFPLCSFFTENSYITAPTPLQKTKVQVLFKTIQQLKTTDNRQPNTQHQHTRGTRARARRRNSKSREHVFLFTHTYTHTQTHTHIPN